MNINEVITVNPEIQFGTPVFTGTMVPVASLFHHLEKGISIDEFLADFSSVKKVHCIAVIDMAGKFINSKNFTKPDENRDDC